MLLGVCVRVPDCDDVRLAVTVRVPDRVPVCVPVVLGVSVRVPVRVCVCVLEGVCVIVALGEPAVPVDV